MRLINTCLLPVFGLIALSGCVSTFTYTPKDPNPMISSVLVEKIRKKTFPATNPTTEDWNNRVGLLEWQTTYDLTFNFKGTISANREAYSSKKISVTGPVTGELETDSMGWFDETFRIKSSTSPDVYSYPPLHFEFGQTLPSLSDGTTVELMAPLAIEMTLKRDHHNLFVVSRKELMPKLIKTEDQNSRDTLVANWVEVPESKPLILTSLTFYSDKNNSITEQEIATEQKEQQRQKAEAAVEQQRQEAETAESNKLLAEKCRRHKKVLSGKHWCDTKSLITVVSQANVAPEKDCLYEVRSDSLLVMYGLLKIISSTGEGYIYALDYNGSEPLEYILGYRYNGQPFFIQKNSDVAYADGSVLQLGFYAYAGIYSYVAVMGNVKNIYSFRQMTKEEMTCFNSSEY